MLTVALLLLTDVQSVPLELAGVTEPKAAALNGRVVLVTLLVGKPSFVWEGRTVAGPEDHPDGIERNVVFGSEVDAEPGKRLMLVGTLMLIRHPECVLGGVRVPAWSEIRVEEPTR